jgi:hypothetical protein
MQPRDDEPRTDEDETPSDEKMYTSEPLETDEGTVRIQQQNVGRDNMRGGGEWPDPDTPAEPPAPGSQ